MFFYYYYILKFLHHLRRYPHLRLRPRPLLPRRCSLQHPAQTLTSFWRLRSPRMRSSTATKNPCPTPRCWCTAAVRRKSLKTTAADTHPSPRMQWAVLSITWRRWDGPSLIHPLIRSATVWRRSWQALWRTSPTPSSSCRLCESPVTWCLQYQRGIWADRDAWDRRETSLRDLCLTCLLPEGTSMAFRQR